MLSHNSLLLSWGKLYIRQCSSGQFHIIHCGSSNITSKEKLAPQAGHTAQSEHWMIPCQLSYRGFRHSGLLFWLCNRRAYLDGGKLNWITMHSAIFLFDLHVCFSGLWSRILHVPKYPECKENTPRTGKSRFFCLLVQMCVWGHLSMCQLYRQIDPESELPNIEISPNVKTIGVYNSSAFMTH